MEFFKKNLFLTSLITLVVVVTIVLGVIIRNLHSSVKKYEKDIKLIIEAEKSFASSPYALNNENVKQAEENYNTINESFKGLIVQLREKYPPPNSESEMTPLKFKLYLRQTCIRMENLLRSADIWIPDSLKYFSYGNYMQPDVLPKNEEINLILNQLEIVQEIVYLVSQSKIDKMLDFKRLNGVKTTKRDLYDFMPFSLSLSGSVESIQGFLNSMGNAKYFLMTRHLYLIPETVKQNKAPKVNSDDENGFLGKNKRLVFTEDVELKATISLDYFVFHDKE